MKKTYKSLYDQIELNDQQKNAIWENVNWENALPKQEKRTQKGIRRIALPIAAAFALVILSGTAALAANNLSVDRIAETMWKLGHGFSTEYEEVSSEQKELYVQYSDVLGIEIELPDGKLYLDNICYDQSYLNIPYRYYPTSEKTPGSPASDPFPDNFCFRFLEGEPADNSFLYDYYFDGKLGMFRYYDPYVQEDGAITGTLTPYIKGARFEQGDVIRICLDQTQPTDLFRPLEEGEDTTGLRLVTDPWGLGIDKHTYVDQSVPPVVLAEFTLEKEPSLLALELAPETATAIEHNTFDSIILSSLSLFVTGSIDSGNGATVHNHFDLLTLHATIVMRDGSVIAQDKSTARGSYNNSDSHNLQERGYEYAVLLSEPINLDDAEWIHIDGTGLMGFEDVDLWIPIHQE